MSVRLPNPQLTAARLGLSDSLTQKLAQEAVSAMDGYVPKKSGALAASAQVSPAQNGRCLIRYTVPYARTVYYTHPTQSRWLEKARQDGAFSRR